MPTKYQQFQVEILNWLKQITEAIIICIIQQFEADFLWNQEKSQKLSPLKSHCPELWQNLLSESTMSSKRYNLALITQISLHIHTV